MKVRLVVVLLAITANIGKLQLAPVGLGIENANSVVIFIDNCNHNIERNNIFDTALPIKYISLSNCPSKRFFYDRNMLWNKLFYIRKRPTIVILRQGQLVYKSNNIEILKDADDIVRIHKPSYQIGIRAGYKIKFDGLHKFTGLIVFWKNKCLWCKKEALEINNLCRLLNTVIISDSNTMPALLPACKNLAPWHLYNDWSIPGAPTHIMVQEGVIEWIDVGYRENILDLVRHNK